MFVDKGFFRKVVSGVVFEGAALPRFSSFVFDSRLVTPGCTFVALRGARCDGHDFVQEAVAAGAAGLIIDKKKKSVLLSLDVSLLSIALVDDVLEAFYTLAQAWRMQFSCPVVGITGSIGKTSTKELLASIVCAAGKNIVVTPKNYNTDIGLAATLLNMTPEHDLVIAEMGVAKRGQMERLAALVRPTLGVITTIAHSHLEGLGSLHDIAQEKRKVFSCFTETNIGIINGDIPELSRVSYFHPVVKFGFKTTNQVQARKVRVKGVQTLCTLKLYNDKHDVVLPTVHTGYICNVLAACAAAEFLDIPRAAMLAGVLNSKPVPGRFRVCPLRAKQGFVVDDAYNANPESMREALLALERLEVPGKKIAVLGDMLEMGANSAFWHRQLGRSVRKASSLDTVILVGERIKAAQETIPHSLRVITVSDWRGALEVLSAELDDTATVLVKASHGMELGNLVDALCG